MSNKKCGYGKCAPFFKYPLMKVTNDIDEKMGTICLTCAYHDDYIDLSVMEWMFETLYDDSDLSHKAKMRAIFNRVKIELSD